DSRSSRRPYRTQRAVHGAVQVLLRRSVPQSALMSTLTLKRHLAAGTPARRMLNKVPEVTVYFWVIKVLCTTVGETASDYLSENVGLGLTTTTFITGGLLALTLVFQFRAPRYVPGIYWLAVVLIS